MEVYVHGTCLTIHFESLCTSMLAWWCVQRCCIIGLKRFEFDSRRKLSLDEATSALQVVRHIPQSKTVIRKDSHTSSRVCYLWSPCLLRCYCSTDRIQQALPQWGHPASNMVNFGQSSRAQSHTYQHTHIYTSSSSAFLLSQVDWPSTHSMQAGP